MNKTMNRKMNKTMTAACAGALLAAPAPLLILSFCPCWAP